MKIERRRKKDILGGCLESQTLNIITKWCFFFFFHDLAFAFLTYNFIFIFFRSHLFYLSLSYWRIIFIFIVVII